MSKRAHLSFGLVGCIAVGFAVLVSTGCGDDSKPSDGSSGKGGQGGAAGGSASGGSGGKAGGSAGSTAGAGGAQGGMGTREEGDQCMSTADCGMGLSCVAAEVQQTPIRICARPCTSASQCGSESCASPYTELAKDSICINTEPAPFGLCGAGVTAVCGGGRVCLYFQQSTVGVCVNLCALDPTKDAGIDAISQTCPVAGQSCISGIVDDGGANEVGLCGVEVERDAECGLDTGKLCKGSDICVPDNFNDDNSPQHCREDCSKMGTCTAGGTCTVFQDITYCKK
jgi:hypothetical protein